MIKAEIQATRNNTDNIPEKRTALYKFKELLVHNKPIEEIKAAIN
jgi:hypothetical protein